jgi:hypothetical protein
MKQNGVSRSHRTRGVSLPELIAVISFMAILTAVALWLVAQASEAAKHTLKTPQPSQPDHMSYVWLVIIAGPLLIAACLAMQANSARISGNLRLRKAAFAKWCEKKRKPVEIDF